MLRTFLLTPNGWQAEKPIQYWTEIFGDILGGNGLLPPDGIDLWYCDLTQKWKRYAGSPYPQNLLKTMVDVSFGFWRGLYEAFPAPDTDLRLEIRRLITRYDFWFFPPKHNVFFLTDTGWVSADNEQPAPNYVECYTRKFFSFSGLFNGCRGADDDPRVAAECPTDLAFVWSCEFDVSSETSNPLRRKAVRDKYPAPVEDLREFIDESRLALEEAVKVERAARNEARERLEKANRREKKVRIAVWLLAVALVIMAVYVGFANSTQIRPAISVSTPEH
jgi:hypothetical protein